MDLTGLRLPERHLAIAPEPAVAGDASSTQKLPRASSAARRGRPAPGHSAATASMPAVRDLSVVPAGPRSGGRRRAPEAPEAVTAPASPRSGGRRRAPEGPETVVAAAASTARSGGRRRAPEVGEQAAPLEDAAASSAAAAGRHRAAMAVDPGRHRKADTGLFPVIKDSTPATLSVTRLDDTFGGRPRSAWAAVGELQPELLTRPMRLSDQVPHARRPRLDGSLTGV